MLCTHTCPILRQGIPKGDGSRRLHRSNFRNNPKEESVKRLNWSIFVLLAASLILGACGQPTQQASPTETIVVATDATWAPFEMLNEGTRDIEGFDIDLMNAIAREAGLAVQYQNVSWDPLLAGMATCQYDAAISAMTITEERKEQFLFSDPYFEAGQIVTVRTENTDIIGAESLEGKVVGAQIGTTGAIEVEQIANVTLRGYDEISQAFQDLMNGQVDAVVADNPVALGYVGANPTRIKMVGDVFTDENYGIAICRNKPELQQKINEGLAKVKQSGYIDELVEKWLEQQ
jgi:polar amino acid transport system substrate-binding protein